MKKQIFTILNIINPFLFGVFFPFFGKYLNPKLDIRFQDSILYGLAVQAVILTLELELFRTDVEERDRGLSRAMADATAALTTAKSLEAGIRDLSLGSRDKFRSAPVTVTVFNKFLHYMPLYVAKDMGFFEEEGLAVEIVPKGNDDLATFALSTTECDFAVTDPMMIFLPGSPGAQPLMDGCILAPFLERVIIYGISQYPISTLVQRDEPATILTFQKPSTASRLAEAWANKRLGGRFHLHEVHLSHPDRLASSILSEVPRWTDKYDIVIMTEPEISWFKCDRELVTIDLQRDLYGTDPYAITSVLSTFGIVKRSPETVRRFLKALRLALQLLNRGTNASVIPDQLLKRAAAAVYNFSSSAYPTEHMMKEDAVRDELMRLVKLGAFPESVIIGPEQRVSLTRAYNLHFPHTVQAGDLIERRIVNAAKEFGLTV